MSLEVHQTSLEGDPLKSDNLGTQSAQGSPPKAVENIRHVMHVMIGSLVVGVLIGVVLSLQHYGFAQTNAAETLKLTELTAIRLETLTDKVIGGGRGVNVIFVVSTGHVGSTTLHKTCESMRRNSSVHCVFETNFGVDLGRKAPRKTGRCNENGTTTDSEASRWGHRQMSMYIDRLQRKHKDQNSLFFVTGHQLICGSLWREACTILGPKMRLLRLRRSRRQTAISLCSHKHPPSTFSETPVFEQLAYAFAPSNQAVFLLPDNVYSQFNCYQTALWEIDELEARFTLWEQGACHGMTLLADDPGWHDARSYQELIRRITGNLTSFFKRKDVEMENHKRHVTNKVDTDDTLDALADLDSEYLRVMQEHFPEKFYQLAGRSIDLW